MLYKNNEVDILTASLTTNFAIDLANRLVADFVATFPDCNSYEKTLLALTVDAFQDFDALPAC